MKKHLRESEVLRIARLCRDGMDRCTERAREATAQGDLETADWQARLREQYSTMRENLLSSLAKRGGAPSRDSDIGDQRAPAPGSRGASSSGSSASEGN
jgi:hypothetical protein